MAELVIGECEMCKQNIAVGHALHCPRYKSPMPELLKDLQLTGDDVLSMNKKLSIERDNLRTELAQAKATIDGLKQLVILGQCPIPDCSDGVIPVQIDYDEWEPQQCQFCHEQSEIQQALNQSKGADNGQ